MESEVLKAGRWMHNQLLAIVDDRVDREQALAAAENWEKKVREAGYNPRTCKPRADLFTERWAA